MGVPRNWSSRLPLVCPVPRPKKHMINGILLFSGLGMLDLGLQDSVRFRLRCDVDSGCRKVLRARMRDGSLRHSRIHKDVRKLAVVPKADRACGSWPCQDVAVCGKLRGFRPGSRSSLYKELVRVAVVAGGSAVFQENLPNVLSPKMRPVYRSVLRRLANHGFTDIRWMTLKGLDVKSPQHRKRWFCLACEPGYRARLRECVPRPIVPDSWQSPPPMERFLLAHGAADTIPRLSMLGNAVISQCAQLSFSILVHNP